MLFLTRREGEEILIGDDIRVVVRKFRGMGRVHLGIEAPPDTLILRREIVDRNPRKGRDTDANANPQQDGPVSPLS